MLPRNHPDRIQIAFDDHRLVANAGLLLPVTLAHHLGLSQLVQERLDLGNAPGRANTGDKVMTLVASALAGGDCIDDADALRTGGTARTLGGTIKAPSTLGTFLRSFRWGHVRQLDRVSRELLARAWAAGAGPGDSPLTIDLDSTICETYGLAKEGARHHGYTGKRGYHPLLAVAAGTGDVLMCRLREGRANTARGAAHFLRETVGRVRRAGASGQLTVRADSGFYTHSVVSVCCKLDVRFSITIRQGINIRMVTDEVAAALASIEYRDDNFERRRLYTAWDNLGDEKRFFTGLERLNAAGIPSKHLMVYMLIGYRPGETMKDILYRFNRLREAGCKPYPMVFERWRQPELRRFARWAIRRYYEVVDWENYKPSVRHRRSDEGPQPFVQRGLVDQQVVDAVWETAD